jgi:hypothetical protein
MAKNLRAKIPQADTLIICDVNKDVLHKFVEEVDTPKRELNIRIAADAREVAEKSVSGIISGLYCLLQLLRGESVGVDSPLFYSPRFLTYDCKCGLFW